MHTVAQLRARLLRKKRERDTSDGSITIEAINLLLQKQNGICPVCEKKKVLGIDHIIPLAGGGVHQIQNIQLLCFPCNNKKLAKLPPHISKLRTILSSPFFPDISETVFFLPAVITRLIPDSFEW